MLKSCAQSDCSSYGLVVSHDTSLSHHQLFSMFTAC